MRKLLGKLIYIFGYPGLYLMLRGSTRAYAVVQVGDEILVTKNWLGLHKKWRLPGGGVRSGEDPATALARELQEEVGITVLPGELTSMTKGKLMTKRFKYSYYLFSLNLSKKPVIKVDNHEILAAEFIPVKTLSTTTVSEELTAALNIAKKPKI